MVAAVTVNQFQSHVIESSNDGLVLVDFWAEWCGPCQALAPVLESVAESNVGRLKVVKVDVDAEPKLAMEHGVRALPTLMLFKGGQRHSQLVGLQSPSAITEMIAAAE